MPAEAEAYDLSSLVILPVAIPLLLFRASLVRICREAPRFMLLAFLLCCVGTVLGALVAHLILRDYLEHSAEIAGVETASNIGDSVNFVAVREALGLDATTASGLLVADNIVMVPMFLVLFRLAASPVSSRIYGSITSSFGEKGDAGLPDSSPFSARVLLRDVSFALAAAFAVAAGGHYLAPQVQSAVRGMVPSSVAAFGLDQIFGNEYVLVSAFSFSPQRFSARSSIVSKASKNLAFTFFTCTSLR
jgi:uncharacterized membrane protein